MAQDRRFRCTFYRVNDPRPSPERDSIIVEGAYLESTIETRKEQGWELVSTPHPTDEFFKDEQMSPSVGKGEPGQGRGD